VSETPTDGTLATISPRWFRQPLWQLASQDIPAPVRAEGENFRIWPDPGRKDQRKASATHWALADLPDETRYPALPVERAASICRILPAADPCHPGSGHHRPNYHHRSSGLWVPSSLISRHDDWPFLKNDFQNWGLKPHAASEARGLPRRVRSHTAMALGSSWGPICVPGPHGSRPPSLSPVGALTDPWGPAAVGCHRPFFPKLPAKIADKGER
jgi:hypothetical protein